MKFLIIAMSRNRLFKARYSFLTYKNSIFLTKMTMFLTSKKWKEYKNTSLICLNYLLYLFPQNVFFEDVLFFIYFLNEWHTHPFTKAGNLRYPSPIIFKYHHFHSQNIFLPLPLSIPTVNINSVWSSLLRCLCHQQSN